MIYSIYLAAGLSRLTFAERVRFLKETPKGVERMCKIMEERVQDEKIMIAANLLKRGKDTIEEIAELTELPIEIINALAEEIKDASA